MRKIALVNAVILASITSASANDAYERYKRYMEQYRANKPELEKFEKRSSPVPRHLSANYQDTISAAAIANGLSSTKTALMKERWWREHMAGKPHQMTGRIIDVESGALSGYWVSLDVGKDIRVRCGLSTKWDNQVEKLRKGERFTCNGYTANTWTEMFGIVFSIDAG